MIHYFLLKFLPFRNLLRPKAEFFETVGQNVEIAKASLVHQMKPILPKTIC